MGKAKKRKLSRLTVAVKKTLMAPSAPMNVVTPGGKIEVKWDHRANATAMGQLAFFAEFLEATGLFDRWVAGCPLQYTSPNAPKVRDVLGTWLLSILDGHCRYAHVAMLRGDAVAPAVLKLIKIMGDESLRRAMAQIAPAPKAEHSAEEQQRRQEQCRQADQWMDSALLESVRHAMLERWILDIDTTIKLLYGRQSGAEIGYNPKKPGRPSHVIHTYWMGHLRLVLQAHVQSGKSGSSANSLPGLINLITNLSPEERPQLVRGDCGFGNERVMCELEEIKQPYLFKLKQSSNVKKLIERHFGHTGWYDAGQGWEAREDTLKLFGWTQSRRVIVMRRVVRDTVITQTKQADPGKTASAKKRKKTEPQQTCLQFLDENGPAKVWEHAVLVTNTDYGVEYMGQLYRDRADCENGFDELKNQWGWGGYSTQDIERCNLSARAVALAYNWWSWYVRLANPDGRLEAITSRPLLLAAVGRITEHGGQRRVLLSITHAAVDQVKAMVTNIREGLQHVMATAPQLTKPQRWGALVTYIVDKIIEASKQKYRKRLPHTVMAGG